MSDNSAVVTRFFAPALLSGNSGAFHSALPRCLPGPKSSERAMSVQWITMRTVDRFGLAISSQSFGNLFHSILPRRNFKYRVRP